jgi:hypothetical protein
VIRRELRALVVRGGVAGVLGTPVLLAVLALFAYGSGRDVQYPVQVLAGAVTGAHALLRQDEYDPAALTGGDAVRAVVVTLLVAALFGMAYALVVRGVQVLPERWLRLRAHPAGLRWIGSLAVALSCAGLLVVLLDALATHARVRLGVAELGRDAWFAGFLGYALVLWARLTPWPGRTSGRRGRS